MNRERRERGKAYVDELKRRPCTDCGVCYPPSVMDFDHVRGEKSLNLSELRTNRSAWSKLLEEIEKCELVCANCHRIRTKLRAEGRELRPSHVAQWIALGYCFIPVY